jgi:formate dehydrogenase subunit delta
MKVEPLIKMANEIAAFFQGEAGLDGAPKLVAMHFSRYWEKRMRQEIIEYYRRTGGEGLDEVALKAVELLATDNQAATSASPQSPAPEG